MLEVIGLLDETRQAAAGRLSAKLGCVLKVGSKLGGVARCLGPVFDVLDARQTLLCDHVKDIIADLQSRIRVNRDKIAALELEIANRNVDIGTKRSAIAKNERNLQFLITNLKGILNNPPFDPKVVESLLALKAAYENANAKLEAEISDLEAQNAATNKQFEAVKARLRELSDWLSTAQEQCMRTGS